MSALPMQPTERDRERFRDAARQHLTWCDFNRTGIDGDYKDAETRYLFKMWWSVERERQLLQNLNMSQGCKLSELLARAEKAESELDAEQALEKVAPDCRACANRGRINGLSQESFCDSCVWQGMSFRKNHYAPNSPDFEGVKMVELHQIDAARGEK